MVCFEQWSDVRRHMAPQSRTGDEDDDNDEVALFFSKPNETGYENLTNVM